jgi:hypothetical protein
VFKHSRLRRESNKLWLDGLENYEIVMLESEDDSDSDVVLMKVIPTTTKTNDLKGAGKEKERQAKGRKTKGQVGATRGRFQKV